LFKGQYHFAPEPDQYCGGAFAKGLVQVGLGYDGSMPSRTGAVPGLRTVGVARRLPATRRRRSPIRSPSLLAWTCTQGRVQLPHAQDDDGPAPVRGCRHRRAEVRLEPAWRCGNGHGNGTVTVCVLPRVTYMHRLLGVSESYLSEYDLVPFFLSRRRVCLSIRCGPKAPRTQAPRYPDSADRHRSDPTVGLSESVAGSVPCSVHASRSVDTY